MAQSEVDLTTPADAAAEVGASAGDARLQRAITAVSLVISNFVGAPLQRQTGVVKSVAGNGGDALTLPAVNLVSIESIAIDGAALDPSEYAIEAVRFAWVRRVGGFWPFTGDYLGSIAPEGARARNTGRIVVTYTAGWVTPGQNALDSAKTVDLPADIQQAALEAVTALWRRRGLDQGVASRSLGGGSVSYRADSPGLLPASTKALLRPYRRIAGAL